MKNLITFILLLNFQSTLAEEKKATLGKEKKRIIYKYKKYQKFDFENLVIDGDTGLPDSLSY